MYLQALKPLLYMAILVTLTTGQLKRENTFNTDHITTHREYAQLRDDLFGPNDLIANWSRKLLSFLLKNKSGAMILDYNSEINLRIVSDTGKAFQASYIVGAGEGDFGCMGACGPGCPRFGVVEQFTKECLVHDACVQAFGIDVLNPREKHPECGSYFNKAKSAWLSYGHFFQKNS